MSNSTFRETITWRRTEDRTATVIGLAIETGQTLGEDLTTADLAAYLASEIGSLWSAVFALAEVFDVLRDNSIGTHDVVDT